MRTMDKDTFFFKKKNRCGIITWADDGGGGGGHVVKSRCVCGSLDECFRFFIFLHLWCWAAQIKVNTVQFKHTRCLSIFQKVDEVVSSADGVICDIWKWTKRIWPIWWNGQSLSGSVAPSRSPDCQTVTASKSKHYKNGFVAAAAGSGISEENELDMICLFMVWFLAPAIVSGT